MRAAGAPRPAYSPARPRTQRPRHSPRATAAGMSSSDGASQKPKAEQQLDVAVVGGGPGGLAAAKAILTARPDLRVAVFERSTLRPRGASLGVQPNGIRALAAIHPDLAEAVLAIDCHPGTRRLFARNGSLVSLLPDEDSPAAYARRRGGPGSMVAWHELQAVLARQLPEGVLHQRAAFDRYEESEDGVTIHFQQAAPSSDGGGSDSAPSPVTARMLVGADGGQSAVRAQCIGDGPPLFLDTAIWRAVVPRPDWWFTEAGAYCLFGGPPATLLAFSIRKDTVAWQAFAPWPAERLDEIGGGRAAYIADGVTRKELGEARRRRALEVFGSWCPQVRSLVEAADPLALTEHGQFHRQPEACKVWGHGRITLVGDAAHMSTPFLAQGTSQAFEDALALGRAIGEHGPTPEALRAYEAFRQPLMEVIHRRSAEMFMDFKAGGAPPQEHLENEALGLWSRRFSPLSGVRGAPA